ncbi:choice-of-anchor M domain-containing protein [Actinacidiphila alni]|uniref:choice-of-anchor M domain-containing protein n=1 Tax=Actinacidiphila alni TaxID=380248 RepID=UPI0034522178
MGNAVRPSRGPHLAVAASTAALIAAGFLVAPATWATDAPSGPAASSAPAAPSVHAAPAATEAPVVAERTVIDVGHVDAISPRMVSGTFRTLLLDDRDALAPVWRTPGSVILHLTQAGAVPISDDTPGFFFLGDPGSTVWTIPQTQDPAVIWAGWSTQSFTSDNVRGDMKLTLEDVDGPGDVVLWEWSPFGEPDMVIDGRAGLPASYTVPTFTHQHANWAFTKPGVYRLKFTWSADLVDGGPVSDSAVYTFAVGDVDTSTITLPGDGPTPDPTTTSPTPDPTTTSPTPSTTGTPRPSNSTAPPPPPTSPTGPAGSADGGTDTSPSPSPTSVLAPAGSPASGETPQNTGTGALASTGSSSVLPLAATGAALTAVGAGAVVATRRRFRRRT